MNNIIDLQEYRYKPITETFLQCNTHVVPVSVIHKFIKGELDQQAINDLMPVLQHITYEWLEDLRSKQS